MNYKTLSKSLVASLLCAGIVGCNSSNDSSITPTPTSTTVNVYTSIDNCSTAADVPNCAFEKGIYVLKIGDGVSDDQHKRVENQVKDFLALAHRGVRERFNLKTVVIGVTENEPDPDAATPADLFVLELAECMNDQDCALDGIELVYTKINEGDENNPSLVDETTLLSTYQKLIQLFDYYIDGNDDTLVGQKLSQAYSDFKDVLAEQKSDADKAGKEYLEHNPCNYGNGQLASKTCEGDDLDQDAIDNGEDGSTGQRDPIHTLQADLNPGAMMGVTYEYMRDPMKASIGEMEGSEGSDFINNAQAIGSGDATALNWTNPAFKKLADYINTWFLTNKK